MALYAEIVEIVAPAGAVAGSRVDVTVRIKNRHSSTIGIMPVAFPDYPGVPGGLYINGLYPNETSANVPAGTIQSFSGYFTMPETNVTIRAYSYWYGADDQWHLDDQMTKGVTATVLKPEFADMKIGNFIKV